MVPNEIPDRPFGIISTDFVTDLPESEGFNAVEVVMCRSTKTVVLIPTVKKIDSDGTVDLLFNNVYRRYGLWDSMISDRGPQFAGKVL